MVNIDEFVARVLIMNAVSLMDVTRNVDEFSSTCDMVSLCDGLVTFGVVVVVGFIDSVEVMAMVTLITDGDLVVIGEVVIALGVADMLELLIADVVAFTFGVVEVIDFIIIVDIVVTFTIDGDLVVIDEMVLFITSLAVADMLELISIFEDFEAPVVMVKLVELSTGEVVVFTFGVVEVVGFIDIVEFMVTTVIDGDLVVIGMVPFVIAL